MSFIAGSLCKIPIVAVGERCAITQNWVIEEIEFVRSTVRIVTVSARPVDKCWHDVIALEGRMGDSGEASVKDEFWNW